MSYSSEVLARSPYGYWRHGEASGTTAADSSGNARDGTYTNGPTLGTTGLLTGDSDTAVTYASASSQRMNVPDDNGLDGLTTFTIVALIKPTTVTGTPMIVGRDVNSGGRSFHFRLGSSKLVFTRIPGSTVNATSATTLVANTQYHVAAVYDGTDIRLYIDGALDGTPAACTGSMGTSTTDLQIAHRRSSTTGAPVDFYNGVLDEVAVFTTALSASDIAALYAAASTPPTSGSASLSLSASGGAEATGGGTAALALSATGDTGADTAGTASLSFSASGGTTAPEAAAGTASLSLSAEAGVVSAASSGNAALDLSAQGQMPLPAAGTASLTFLGDGAAAQLFATDTSNLFDGLDLVCLGTVTITRPDVVPPTAPPKYDKALPYPEPVMVDGRPT